MNDQPWPFEEVVHTSRGDWECVLVIFVLEILCLLILCKGAKFKTANIPSSLATK